MTRRLKAILRYIRYISRGKAETYLKYGLALVPGKREGVFISDINGKKYMNFHCNGGVFNFGHNCTDTVAALKGALDIYDVGSDMVHSPIREQLADELARLMPGKISSVLLCASGSEANDAAIKVSFAHTGRTEIVSANGAYHGGSGFAVATGDPAFKNPFGPELPGFRQVPFGDFSVLEEVIDGNTAAVIFETIPATLGMKLPPDDYFQKVRSLCDQRGSLLIIDEVQTGLGRTGKLWAIEHWGVEPDIIVIGKGLSGGVYPIAAACFNPKLVHTFATSPFLHRSEYGGSDLGCAVALKTLEICSAPQFLDHVNSMADFFAEKLNGLKVEFPETISEIRQKGLFTGIVFRDEFLSLLMLKILFDNGIYTVYAGNDKKVIQFLPMLNITMDEAVVATDILRKSLRSLKKPTSIVMLKALKFISPKTV